MSDTLETVKKLSHDIHCPNAINEIEVVRAIDEARATERAKVLKECAEAFASAYNRQNWSILVEFFENRFPSFSFSFLDIPHQETPDPK